MTKSVSEKRRRGKPALQEGVESVRETVRLTPDEREKFRRLGGAKWLRERINEAPEPSP